jgi:hydroxypyruvate isomerase
MMRTSRNHHRSSLTRRNVLAASLGLTLCGLGTALVRGDDKPEPAKLKGRIKQAITPGVLRKMSVEQMCEVCVQFGLHGLDFVAPSDWPTLKKHGLICTMAHSGAKGLNRKENHEQAVAALRQTIEAVAEAGFPNVIVMSGNRAGLSDEEGAANCIEGLKQIAALAEEKKITICMELLNSKRNHKDYQCDRTAWGAEVVKAVGSPRVKLLYDIYHMQVQEGDVIATIRENIDCIAHFHTAGVPGRHEIDETQELYYPAIMQAIVDLKFDGYVAHEYNPTQDPVESLKKSVAICDV